MLPLPLIVSANSGWLRLSRVTLAEAWLDRKAVERLVKLGLMPFLSVRGKNALQLFRFVSGIVALRQQPERALEL